MPDECDEKSINKRKGLDFWGPPTKIGSHCYRTTVLPNAWPESSFHNCPSAGRGSSFRPVALHLVSLSCTFLGGNFARNNKLFFAKISKYSNENGRKSNIHFVHVLADQLGLISRFCGVRVVQKQCFSPIPTTPSG